MGWEARKAAAAGVLALGMLGAVSVPVIAQEPNSTSRSQTQTSEQEPISPDFKILSDVIGEFIDKSQEPKFWDKMHERLATDPDKYFTQDLPLSSDESGRVKRFMYFENPGDTFEESVPSFVVFVDPAAIDASELGFRINLVFNERGEMSSDDEPSILQTYTFKPSTLVRFMNGYFQTPTGIKEAPVGVFIDSSNGQTTYVRQFSSPDGINYVEQATPNGIISLTASHN